MLPNTRVARRALDMGKLGQALARPGMDTRSWVCEAIVEAFKLDPDEGAFADVTLVPSGEPETVRVGAFYAGPGFGFYAPLEKDDHVIVAFPNGDPDQGGVIVARLWSASDPPSDTAKSNDSDVSIHIKDGATLRIVVSGSGKIMLGGDGLIAADNGVVLGSGIDSLTGSTYYSLQSASDIVMARKK